MRRLVSSAVATVLAVVLSCPLAAAPPERLVVVNSASWVPYSYLDAAGEPQGVLVDLWRLFGERTGVEIEFRLVDWAASLEALETGGADVHGGLTPTRTRTELFDFSTPILRVGTLLFMPRGDGIRHLGDLEGATVGVVEGAAEVDFLHENFPNLRQRVFATSAAMVDAALAGTVDGFVADFATGHYRLARRDALADFEPVDALFTAAIEAAVPAGEAALLAFVEAGFAQITEAERQTIQWRWLVAEEQLPPWLLPLTGGICGAALLLAIALHYVALRRAVRARTADLEAANAELARRAATDPLTGVANRQRFRVVAEREMSRARRHGRPLSVAMLDLDRFKAVNDRYGHLAGDAVLRRFAATLAAELRVNDLPARLGGDEFAILLPETPLADAERVIRRLVGRLGRQTVPVGGEAVAVAVSAGVAEYRADDSLETWLERADRALYVDKAAIA